MSSRNQLGLAGLIATLLASVSLMPVTQGAAWLGVAIPAVVIVGLIGMSARTLGLPLWLTAVGQTVIGLHVVALASIGWGDTWYGLPTLQWMRAVVFEVNEGGLDIGRYAAPIPDSPGLTFIVAGGVCLVAVAVDTLISAGAVAWTAVPLVILQLAPAIGTPQGVSWPGFVCTAIGYLALLVLEHRQHQRSWGRVVTAEHDNPGPQGLVTVAAGSRRVALIGLAAAVLLPAFIPALSLGSLGFNDGGGGGSTVQTRNPIVDLKRDLARPENVDLITYTRSPGSSEYLRVVTLDVFNGAQWESSDRRVPESQRVNGRVLPEAPGRDGVATALVKTQDYSIEILDSYESTWLPLPYAASVIDIDGDWRYDTESLDVVGVDSDTSGQSYSVSAQILVPTAATLKASIGPIDDSLDPLVSLPAGMTSVLDNAVEEAYSFAETSPATPYDSAVAIQNWFRSEGNFEYSLDTKAGTADSDLEDFLNDRSGYCEQYAATMALMARHAGIPARVAVGFLAGRRDTSGRFVVRAHDSHAWPELYFSGIGWVRFEPTPSVQTGAAPGWTDPNQPVAPTAVPGATTSVAPGASELPRLPEDREGGPVELDTSRDWTQILTYSLAGLAVIGVLAFPATSAALRRRRRWARTTDARDKAEVAWTELQETVSDLGLSWSDSDTLRVNASRTLVETQAPEYVQDRVGVLVSAAELAKYAPEADALDQVDGKVLREASVEVRRDLLGAATRRRRWLAWVLPSAARIRRRPKE